MKTRSSSTSPRLVIITSFLLTPKQWSLLLSVPLSIVLLCGATAAQFGVRLDIKAAANNASSGGGYVAPRKAIVIQKVNKVVVTKREVVRVSNLSIVTEPGAKVLLESTDKSSRPFRREIVADASGSAIFDELKPGDYKVSASKDGYVTQEQDQLKILPQRPHVLDLSLPPVTYKLKIETPGISDGEVRYALAQYKGKDAKGSIISEEFGNTCFVKIQRKGTGGEAVISDLKQGYYNLDIRPSALEYEPTLVGLNVPTDTEEGETGETKSFEIALKKKISTEIFGAAWTRDGWEMPSQGWSLGNRMKINNATGTALPRDDRYRYYTNFEMISDVKMLDGRSVGFAIRAVDSRNYYYVQITGPNAAEPNFAKGFIVANGEPRQFFSVSAPFASTTSSKNGFRVIIKGNEKGFAIWIENSETGVRKPVTTITDPYNTYQKGAVGIASLDPASFEVTSFQVCPSECR
jgi:hypothetical protein